MGLVKLNTNEPHILSKKPKNTGKFFALLGLSEAGQGLGYSSLNLFRSK